VIHNGQAGDVESVMVDGRWLMRERRVLTIDKADVVTRAEEIASRVWRQLVARYPNVPFPITLPPPASGEAHSRGKAKFESSGCSTTGLKYEIGSWLPGYGLTTLL